MVLALLVAWALDTPLPPPIRWSLALAAAGAAAVVWGRLVAPRSPRRLTDPLRLIVEALVFSAAGAAAAALGGPVMGLGFFATAVGAALAVRWVDRCRRLR